MTGRTLYVDRVGENNGYMVLTLLADFTFDKYEHKLYRAGGIFSKHRDPVVRQRNEVMLQIGMLSGEVFNGFLGWNPQISGFDDIGLAYEKMDFRKPIRLADLGQIETVNAHQWNGHHPIEHKGSTGAVVYREPAMWEIATFDQRSGERRQLLITHMQRDVVFRIQTRMQMMVDLAKDLLKGWEDKAEYHRQKGARQVEQLPEADQAEAVEMIKELNKRYIIPDWEWRAS